MDNFNKVFSFILGLVVVIVFFAVLTGRIKLPSNKNSTTVPLFARTSPNPTPIPKVNINQQGEQPYKANNYQTTNTKTIPATGLPTIFLPSLLASALIGKKLSNTGKK